MKAHIWRETGACRVRSWKRMAFLTLWAFASLWALSGCGGGPGGRALKLYVAAPQGSIWGVAADTFAQIVEESAEGRYRVEITYAASGESGAHALEPLLNGDVDFDLRSVSDFREREERLFALYLPWIFSGYQDADDVLFNGAGRDVVRHLIRGIGPEPLALAENGFLQFTNDRRPVTAPADLRGLTVCVRDDVWESAFFSTFGAEPVLIDPDERFLTLQEGAVRGQQDALNAVQAAQIDKVQRYLTVWNSAYDPICLSASAQFWETLDAADRELFQAAAREACAAEITASRALRDRILADFRASGVEVTTLTESQIRDFRIAAAPVYALWRTKFGAETLAALGYSD